MCISLRSNHTKPRQKCKARSTTVPITKEVFTAAPPPPSPYQRGRSPPSCLGEQIRKHSVAYIGFKTGRHSFGLTLFRAFSSRSPPEMMGDSKYSTTLRRTSMFMRFQIAPRDELIDKGQQK